MPKMTGARFLAETLREYGRNPRFLCPRNHPPRPR